MRGKRLAKCTRCGRKRFHYAKGKCQSCYDYEYKRDHPEFWKRCNEKSKERYRTDPVYRQYMLDYQKEYFKKPENLEKKRIYERKYYKTHKRIRVVVKKLKCPCGHIDIARKQRLSGKHPHKRNYKCPNCGKYTEKTVVLFNRLTKEEVNVEKGI